MLNFNKKIVLFCILTQANRARNGETAGHPAQWPYALAGRYIRIMDVHKAAQIVTSFPYVYGSQDIDDCIEDLNEPLKDSIRKRLPWLLALLGLCNGLVLGLLSFVFVGLYIALIKHKTFFFAYAVSGCIGASLVLSMLISSATGTLIPMFFDKIKVDPAVA